MRLGDLDEALRMIVDSREDNPYTGDEASAWRVAHNCAIICVKDCTTIDAAPVVHGRWVKTNYFDVHFCSCCDKATNTRSGLPNYCPNCGARMDGE